MDGESFQTVYDRILGKYRNCDAIVVDTRYNGGGWLHNDLAVLLSGKEYVKFKPRGREIGHEPFAQWTKPSVMLVTNQTTAMHMALRSLTRLSESEKWSAPRSREL